MSTALILFGSMAVFLIIGVPIAFALGASVWATIVFSYPVFYSCGEFNDKRRYLKTSG